MKHARLVLVFGLVLPLLCLAASDLAEIRKEGNPAKRAERALEHAFSMFQAADQAYLSGDWTKTLGALQEVRDAVVLAGDALRHTGKDPRRSPRHFKRAEIKTRELLRKIEGFGDRMSVDEREKVQTLTTDIRKVHDSILEGILGAPGDEEKRR